MPMPTDPTKKADVKDDTSSTPAKPAASNMPDEPKKLKYTRRNRKSMQPHGRTPAVSNPSDSGEGSEFEDEEGTVFIRDRHLGAGNSASGRLFREKNKLGSKEVVILRPVGEGWIAPRMTEVFNKLNFFRTLYPKHYMRLITDLIIDAQGNTTYRLILPLLPGVMYSRLNANQMNEQQKIKVSLSAINTLEDCHAKNIIVIDLNANNIHYDAQTNKSYLIDGGTSTATSEDLNPSIFLVDTAKIDASKRDYPHIAPECWTSEKELSAKANAAIDIYSLGIMLKFYLNPDPNGALIILVERCLNTDPTKRPSLAELKIALLLLLPPEEASVFAQPSTAASKLTVITKSMTAQEEKTNTNPNLVIQQAKSFLAAIQALKACHEKQLIVLDLERDRMRYDANAKGYSIDSQYATKCGEKLNPNVYCLQSPKAVREAQHKMPHIAPECWSSDEELDVLATEAMDIYSLGVMLKRTIAPEPGSLIDELIDVCIHPEPTERPSLDALTIPLNFLASGINPEQVRALIENGPIQQLSTPQSQAGSDVHEVITYHDDESPTPKLK